MVRGTEPHRGTGSRTDFPRRSFVSTERFDFDVRIWNVQAPEQPQHPDDHAGRAADVVDRVREIACRLLDEFRVNPSDRALPAAVGRAREGVEHAEVRVQGLQRLEFASIYNLVLAPIAVDEPNRDGQRLVRRVLGHAFQGRDADATRDEHRRARFVQHEVADWAEDADLVVGLEGREGALVGGVREPDRVFEVGARGTRREGHGSRVQALLGLQLQERELRGTEGEGLRFLHLDRAGGRREWSRGHDSSFEAPRGSGQCIVLPFAGAWNTMAVFRDSGVNGKVTPRSKTGTTRPVRRSRGEPNGYR